MFRDAVGIGVRATVDASDILRGRFQLFSALPVDPGQFPDWQKNPLSGEGLSATGHWSRVNEFARGDIKLVWELSRFSWAFALGRAYAATADERYAERFWQLFEHWMERNPPNRGVNWQCGQEATFRMMAVVFARHICAKATASSPNRVRKYHAFLRATGMRIAANIDYALSQSNNHGISEAIGLLTAAVLLPEERESEAWFSTGTRALKEQIDALVYSDGAFAQHSANYHRVLLHDLMWCVAILRAVGKPVPGWLNAAGRRALKFLATLLDPDTGRVPLYGANDGANILPLSDSDYLDFRPVVQAASAIFEGRRRLPPGPWDEAVDWMDEDGGRSAEDRRQRTDSGRNEVTVSAVHTGAEERVHFPEGGCFLWRRGDFRVFFRCPTRFRHRPSQADLLHVDLQWRGHPIGIDAGTYSYNTTGEFEGALKEAAVHNTVTFDGEEPMEKAGRFLYLPWPRGSAGWNEQAEAFEATHDGWKRIGARHMRRIKASESAFLVEDLVRTRSGRVRLHWLLADYPHELDTEKQRMTLSTPAGRFVVQWEVPQGANASVVRADPHSNRGWWSPYYAVAEPAISLAIEFDVIGEERVVTSFGNVLEPAA